MARRLGDCQIRRCILFFVICRHVHFGMRSFFIIIISYISVLLGVLPKVEGAVVTPGDSVRVKTLRAQVRLMINEKPDSALFYAVQMLHFAQEKQMTYFISDAWDLQSSVFENKGMLKESIKATDSAMRYARLIPDPVGTIYFLINKGSLAMKAGENFEALQSFNDAWQLAQHENKPDRMVAALNNIGAVYHYLGDDENALRYFIQSYELRIKHNLTEKLAYALNNIGAIYAKYGDQQSAIEYHTRALETAHIQNDAYNIRIALTNLGQDYKNLKQFETSLAYFGQALKAAENSKELSEQAHVLEQTGFVLLDIHKENEALKYFHKALEISYQTNIQFDIASLSIQLGKLYLAQNDIITSQKYLMNAWNISKSLNAISLQQQSAEVLNDLFFKAGDAAKARTFEKINTSLKDSVYRMESDLKIANLKNQFELNNRVKELELKNEELAREQEISKSRLYFIYYISIVLLLLLSSFTYILFLYRKISRKNRIIEEKEQQLQALLENEKANNALKTNLISTINHEFRTPLAILSSNVQMLTHYKDSMSPEMQQESFGFIEQSMSNLLQMLDNFTAADVKSILQLQPKPVNVSQLCQNLVLALESIQGIGKRIELVDKVNNPLRCVDSLLIAHILRNLLNNALKFSNQQTVLLQITEDQSGAIVFKVTDHGIGIPSQDIDHIFDDFFRANNAGAISGTGIGMSVVKRAVELLNGNIQVKSETGKGTTVTVTIPADKPCPHENETLK